LLSTGSSDYHGPDHRLFSSFLSFDLCDQEPNLGPIAHGTLAAPSRGTGGLCFWLTGLSGSGKSTVGRLAAGQLRDRGHQVEVLDGDDVRQNLCAGLGFSREDRDVNVRRIAWVADLLSRNNVVTFVAAVSPYRSTRDEARARMGERFVEVHVKALYERARAGKIQAFTGVSDPYEEPLAPELTLDTEAESPEDSARRLVEYVEARLTTSIEGADPATV
jgi:adenylylsulfate kinase